MEKKNMKTGLSFGLVILAAAFLIGSVFYVNKNTVNTITVSSDKVENKIYQTGLVTCQVAPLYAKNDGEALFVYEEGRFVLPYVKVATVYSGSLTEESRQQLRALNNKMALSGTLESYQKNIYMDTGAMNREINKAFVKITSETSAGNYKNVYDLKNDILSYQSRVLEQKGVKKKENVAANLAAEVTALEKTIQASKESYKSPMAGLFSSKVDNLDEILTPESAKSMTPKDYEALAKEKSVPFQNIVAGKPFAKIINNFEWYLAAVFEAQELEGLNPGSTVELRIVNHSDAKVSAVVESLSEEEDGKILALLKSTKYIEDIYTAREVEFELIKNTYVGLKIPVSALIEKDGEAGVFVVKDGIYRFVKVKILYQEKNFALIEDLSSEVIEERQNVIRYDLLVVNPQVVKDGDIAS